MKQPLEFSAKQVLSERSAKKNKIANVLSLLASTFACAS